MLKKKVCWMKVEMIYILTVFIAANLKNKRSQWPPFWSTYLHVLRCINWQSLMILGITLPKIWNFASYTIYQKSISQPLSLLCLPPLQRINKWNPGWRKDVHVNYCFNPEVGCFFNPLIFFKICCLSIMFCLRG